MEQRIHGRRAAALDAVVGCPRFGLLRGRIADLGPGGLYIQAETSIVPIGAEVTVTFQPDKAIDNERVSIKGRVVHQNLHGFGVEFDELEAHCRIALQRMLPMMPAVPGGAAPVRRAV